jgi:hypothetical protein
MGAPQRFDKASNETKLIAKIRPDLRTPEASISNPIWSMIFADFSPAQGPSPLAAVDGDSQGIRRSYVYEWRAARRAGGVLRHRRQLEHPRGL